MVFIPNITTDHAITHTIKSILKLYILYGLTLSATRDKSWHLFIVVSTLSYCTRAVTRFLYRRFLFSLLLGLNFSKFSRLRHRVAAILRTFA